MRVEQRLLVLLQILVVGERQPLHHGESTTSPPIARPALPRASSATSGFFFCGMSEEPVQKASSR